MDQATPAGIPAGSSHAFVHRTCLKVYNSEFGVTFPVVSFISTGTDATELLEQVRDPVATAVEDVEVEEAVDEEVKGFN